MSLDYVFGPVVAVSESMINTNLQFFRVKNNQPEWPGEYPYGWAWDTDDGLGYQGDASGGGYATDPMEAIDDLLRALREELTDRVEEWYETHPKAQAALDKHRAEMSRR